MFVYIMNVTLKNRQKFMLLFQSFVVLVHAKLREDKFLLVVA
jgi:hypothetical protein